MAFLRSITSHLSEPPACVIFRPVVLHFSVEVRRNGFRCWGGSTELRVAPWLRQSNAACVSPLVSSLSKQRRGLDGWIQRLHKAIGLALSHPDPQSKRGRHYWREGRPLPIDLRVSSIPDGGNAVMDGQIPQTGRQVRFFYTEANRELSTVVRPIVTDMVWYAARSRY